MGERKNIQAYLAAVQEQIRWKRARPVLALELERHLEDQTAAYMAEGTPEDEAERLAIADMGDPVEVGAELDRVHRPRPQWGLLALTIALACGGTILRLILTSGWHSAWEDAPIRSASALALGTACLLGAYFLDVSRLARYAGRIYLAVLITGYGYFLAETQLGGRYNVYSSTRRVLYYLVLLLPVVYALWVYWCREKGWRGLVLAWAGIFPVAFLSSWWSVSFTNGIVLMCAGFAVVLYAAWQEWFGLPRRQGFGAALGATAGLAALNVWWVLHFTSRFLYIVQPELDPHGKGYFVRMVREFLRDIPLVRSASEGAAANIGTRFQNAGYDIAETLGRDFLPAMLAARWGWLAFGILLAVTAALLGWLLVRGLRQTHRLGRLVVLTAALSLGVRALMSTILNLGVVIFGTGFPFLGGNSFMVIDMTLIGLALSVFRCDSIAREEPASPIRRIRRIRLLVEYR